MRSLSLSRDLTSRTDTRESASGRVEPLPRMRRRHRSRNPFRQSFSRSAPDVFVLLTLVLAAAGVVGLLNWTYGPNGPAGPAHPSPHAVRTPPTTAAVSGQDLHDGRIVAATPAALAHLVVDAVHGPCWVVVREGSATGKVLYAANLAQGQRMTASAPRLFLRLGAASQVEVTVNGRHLGRALAGTVDTVLSANGAAP
jgi:uncharacterized protein DUF4115